jgi:hypothetical protein
MHEKMIGICCGLVQCSLRGRIAMVGKMPTLQKTVGLTCGRLSEVSDQYDKRRNGF